jgi:GTP:adenosylcobinamide-phosphate guanylyltransferase
MKDPILLLSADLMLTQQSLIGYFLSQYWVQGLAHVLEEQL